MIMIPAKRGNVIIIAAPSGAGKTSLVNALIKSMPGLKVSVSYTTRPRRFNEQDGINYYFIEPVAFETMIDQDVFLEHALVFGHYYGTSREWVESQLQQGMDVILEIDWQGAQQIRQQMPDSISIFILPPSYEVLSQRLKLRGQDNPLVIEERLRQARHEITHYQEFDYLLVNDDFNTALENLQAVLHSLHLRQSIQAKNLRLLLANLLA
jgi:guanylate kinase